MQNRLSYSSQTPIFPNFHLFFQNFALCFLLPIFQKKKLFAGKIGAALVRIQNVLSIVVISLTHGIQPPLTISPKNLHQSYAYEIKAMHHKI